MPSLVLMPTPKDMVLNVTTGGRAEHAGQPCGRDWRADLGELCAYYREVIVDWFRSRGVAAEDAEDLAGDFIHRWLAGNPLRDYVPGPVPFRGFLSRCLANFLCEQAEARNARKRGGGVEKVPDMADELPCEAAPWLPSDDVALARAVYERALEAIRGRLGGDVHWDAIMPVALAMDVAGGESYEALSARTGLKVGAIKVRVHRLRREFWDAYEAEVARACGPGVAVGEEMAALVEALAHAARHRL